MLPYRPEQAKFNCIACGHEADADEQSAINIARKHLLMQTLPLTSDESTQTKRRAVRDKWGEWYRERAGRGWN